MPSFVMGSELNDVASCAILAVEGGDSWICSLDSSGVTLSLAEFRLMVV